MFYISPTPKLKLCSVILHLVILLYFLCRLHYLNKQVCKKKNESTVYFICIFVLLHLSVCLTLFLCFIFLLCLMYIKH